MFNGTEAYPANELLSVLQRFGAEFVLPKSELTRDRLHGYLRRAGQGRDTAAARVEARS